MENTKLQIDLHIRIRQETNYSNGFDLNETIIVGPKNFLEVCEILATFHEVAERFKTCGTK